MFRWVFRRVFRSDLAGCGDRLREEPPALVLQGEGLKYGVNKVFCHEVHAAGLGLGMRGLREYINNQYAVKYKTHYFCSSLGAL